MIRNVVLEVERHFIDNWTHSEVNYDEVGYTPIADKWIELLVVPILSERASIDGCTIEHFELHLMAYGKNKVVSGALMDNVITFLQNKKIGSLRVSTWRQIANGNLETGTYFYKVIFDAKA